MEAMPSATDTRKRLIGGAPARVSDRAFGYVFAATLAAIGAVAWLASAQTLSAWLLVISGALLAAAFFTPELLSPLNALRARLLDSVTPPITDFAAYSPLFGGIRWCLQGGCC